MMKKIKTTKSQIRALKASIKNWESYQKKIERFRDKGEISNSQYNSLFHDGDQCPLCKLNDGNCDECVIGNECFGTPYYDFNEMFEEIAEDCWEGIGEKELTRLASCHNKMIIWLKKLLTKCVSV